MKKIEIETDSDLLHYEPGYVGAFTRAQVKDAIPNGSRVKKTKIEPGDTHLVGEQATILGSLNIPTQPNLGTMYFVEWDKSPGIAVACVDWKLGKA